MACGVPKQCVIIVLLYRLHVLSSAAAVANNVSTFEKRALCSVQDKITSGCMIKTSWVRGVSHGRDIMTCSRTCSNDVTCVAVSQNVTSGECYSHAACGVDVGAGCLEEDADSQFVLYALTARWCLHGGSWDDATGSCRCVDYWVGDQCDRRPSSCLEAGQAYNVIGTQFWVDLNVTGATDLIYTSCLLMARGIYNTCIFKNHVDGIGFNRTWSEYVDGFKTGDSYWLGLKNMVIFNRAGHSTIRLSVQFRSTSVGYFHTEYRNVKISGPENGYAINFTSTYTTGELYNHNASLEECLEPLQGISFSTWDNMTSRAGGCPLRAGTLSFLITEAT